MHTRRIATFFLGAWLASSLVMLFLSVESPHASAALMVSPMPQAKKMIDTLGADQASLLLRHAAEESSRSAMYNWERVEIAVALILGAFLFMGTQKRVLPILLCGAMLVLVMFQHFGIATELAYRGRETDFPPGNALIGPVERLHALQAVYYGTEIVKLVAGGILASYLFVFRSSRRSNRKETTNLDHLDRRPVRG